jgi:hypothetical protein
MQGTVIPHPPHIRGKPPLSQSGAARRLLRFDIRPQ